MKKKLFKSIVCLLITLLLLAMLPTQVFAADNYPPANWCFEDVAVDWWSFPYIKLLRDSNVINGTSATTFEPEAFVTRAQFVKMLGCVAGIDIDQYSGSSFKDVKASAWYAPYVQWAAKTGVTTGTYPKIFEPNAHILRQDIATMIYRYTTLEKIELPQDGKVRTFVDDKDIASYAKDAVTAMQKAGIINGEKNKDKTYSFHPTQKATREQTAKMLCVLNEVNLLKFLEKGERQYSFEVMKNWVLAHTNRNYYGAIAYTETGITEDDYRENYTVYYDEHSNKLVFLTEIKNGNIFYKYTVSVSKNSSYDYFIMKFEIRYDGECIIYTEKQQALDAYKNNDLLFDQITNGTTLTNQEIEELIYLCRDISVDFGNYVFEQQICRPGVNMDTLFTK